jgi:hypothetical protein
MPFIREYWNNAVSTEATFVAAPRESPIAIALHETIHVVICRPDWLDIKDVIEQDDAAWTRLLEPQRFTIAALMAPEIYMAVNNIAFSDESVSGDRNAVAECFLADAVEDVRQINRELLEIYFQCSYVRTAIGVLSAHMDEELREHKVMDGASIHKLIDPILKDSPYAYGLREKLAIRPSRQAEASTQEPES